VVRKLKRDALLAELAALEGIIAELPSGAVLTAKSLRRRLAGLEEELRSLEAEPDTSGAAALVFGGGKVYGSRAIDADFAVRTLKAFQELVAKKAAGRIRGSIGQKGPLPERDLARLSITGTVRGSFGFLLQEEGDPALFPTAVKEAIGEAAHLLDAICAEDESRFVRVVEEADPRLFVSLREFFKALHDADGTVKIVQGDEERAFNRLAVERAFERVEHTSVEDVEQTAIGRLIGVLPVSRTFEFTRDDTGQTIRGKVGPQVSGDFLGRIEAEMLPLGKRWKVKLSVRTISRRRASPREQFILMDVEEATRI
jgi:hypothetical protein